MDHGFGGPPHHGPRGGFHGGYHGGGEGRMHSFHDAMRSYESHTRPAPIRGARGFANDFSVPSGKLEVFNWLDSYEIAYSKNEGQRFRSIRSFFRGTWSFMTEPWQNSRYDRIITMTQDAFDQNRITKTEYDTRMLRANSNYYWFKYKAGYISLEQYNEKMNQLEQELTESNNITR